MEINEIINEARRILGSLNLVFDEKEAKKWLGKHRNRLVLICHRDLDKEEFVFKYQVNDEESAINNFQKEVKLLRRINLTDSYHFETNNVIEAGKKWALLSKVPGHQMGNIIEFEKNEVTDKSINSFIFFLSDFLRFDDQYLFDHNVSVRETKKMTELAISKIHGKHPLFLHKDKITHVFDRNEKYISNRSNYVFSHGDLSPLNILREDDNFAIIDWELAQMRPRAYDSAYLYHRLWRYPDQQKEFLKLLLKTTLSDKETKDNFYFWLVLWFVNDLYYYERMLRVGHPFVNAENFSNQYVKGFYNLYILKSMELLDDLLP